MVLTTSKTTTTRMLSMLPNTSVTGRYVAAMFTSLGETCRHFLQQKKVFCQHTNFHPTCAQVIHLRPLHKSSPQHNQTDALAAEIPTRQELDRLTLKERVVEIDDALGLGRILIDSSGDFITQIRSLTSITHWAWNLTRSHTKGQSRRRSSPLEIHSRK
jgi:hypothetical protein